MSLYQVSPHKAAARSRSAVTVALFALAVAFVIIGNITAAGPAVYRAHSLLAEAR